MRKRALQFVAAELFGSIQTPAIGLENISSAEYHARQLVRVIKGEKWDD